MLDNLFSGVFDTAAVTISPVNFLLCMGVSLVLGLALCAMMMWHSRSSGSYAGMGYLAYSVLFTLIMGGATMLFTALHLGERNRDVKGRTLHITIPESLDYTGVFDPVLAEYAESVQLQQVKSTNMGSLFKLTYDLTLRDTAKEKELIDALRCRNGNLEITISQQESVSTVGL